MAECETNAVIAAQTTDASIAGNTTDASIAAQTTDASIAAQTTDASIATTEITVVVGGTATASGATPRTKQSLLGTIDGVNKVFTTSESFLHNGLLDECVYRRGLLMSEGVGCDYIASESGGAGTGYDTITFATAPKSGDALTINYFIA